MVPGLANLGCYFSLSGFLTGLKSTKAKQMLKSEVQMQILKSITKILSHRPLPHHKDTENIHIVLKYVASLLEMPETEHKELSYKNATKLFSYPGSKVHPEAGTMVGFAATLLTGQQIWTLFFLPS
ncbi:hypothetical protein C2845_PM03G29860 [Panicum miliaceum]|uniref:Uncharacterized protein n=1 Tax=Panicum miliaceum TaxID=4540 RepID=A0A3L6TCH0_PANMI|nr:hypothetical protein C2845_PM03G29860 [Panicum miliaceum]